MRSEKDEFFRTYKKSHLLGKWQNKLRAKRGASRLMDRDNENWRSLWTLEMISRIAVHQSGVTARVARSPDDPGKDRISLENTANVDLSPWDLDELADEVMELWLEGNFERA
jgi:hypothetical protein